MEKDRYTKEEIETLLYRSNDTLIKGLLRIYNHQTTDEQRVKDTKYHNGIGFRPCDARILSSMAEFYIRNKFLSEKQIGLVKIRMKKYVGQLTKVANKKISI